MNTTDIDRRAALVGRIALSLIAIGGLLALAARMPATEPYLPFAVAGATALWIVSAPGRREWLAWAVAVAAIAIIQPFPKMADPVLWVASLAALSGLASFALLLLRLIWSAKERPSALASLIPAALLPLYILSAQHMLIIAQAMHATTLDLYLFKFDGSLGFQPSFWMGSLFFKSIVLRWTCLIVYYSLPLGMGVAYAASLDTQDRKRSWRLLLLFIVAGLFGWGFYNLFPATGPRFVFGSAFPRFPLPYNALARLMTEPVRIAQSIPRNAMPSLHMTWVILIWWNIRRSSSPAKAIAFLYVLLTALGTLGIGEHYLIDLIVAFPFALMIQSVCIDQPWQDARRWIAFSCGLVLTLSWSAVLRHPDIFFVSRILPWLAILMTLAASELVRQRALVESKGERTNTLEANTFPIVTSIAAEEPAMPYTQ